MWPDKQTIFQIIVLLFFAGAAVVQVLFRALAKAQRPQPPRPAPPGGRPEEKAVKNVRDFLKEIRTAAEKGVAEARQGESRKVPVPSEGQVLVWETVEEPKAAPSTQPTGSRARDRDESRRSDRDRRRAEGAPPARQRAAMSETKRVHEYLEDLSRREVGAAEPALAPAAESQTASLESALEKKLRVRSAGAKRALPRPAGALVGGLTIRDAMIAQVILGPPRCRGRHTRRP